MNYIFDFDGTLANSLPLAVQIINSYLTKCPRIFNHHKPITAHQIRSKGSKKLLKEFHISTWKLYLLVALARLEVSKHKNEIALFPALKQQLKKLSTNNRLFVLTSNSQKHTQYILQKHQVLKYFTEINSSLAYFGKHKKLLKLMKKYKLNPEQTFYIGDETRDVEAAHKAGIKAIAVSWGFEDKNLLAKSKPYKIISNLKDLSKLL